MKHKTFFLFSKVEALKLSFTMSFILNAILFIGYVYNKEAIGFIDKGFQIIYMYISNVLLFYLLFQYDFKIIQQKFKFRLKFWIIILGSISISLIYSIISSEFLFRIIQDITLSKSFLITKSIIKDLIVVLIVLLLTFLLSQANQRQQAMVENERLIAENIRIRYEVLKNQVDPHFLFNSLNTLDGLIGVDDEKAHDFVQNVSLVFRYAINNKEIMHLKEELNFTESYANLMKIRYGNNFQIQYNIADKYENYFIMPISLQLLVENAIKHNVISTKYPLVLLIETTDRDTIKVQNKIHLKTSAEPGEGIGLANLTERYHLLFQKEISISKTDIFCVEIPLIKQIENAKIS